MTKSTTDTWRRRCLAAEERAEIAERSAKRWRSTSQKKSETIAGLLDAYESLQGFSKNAEQTLEQLARIHLGSSADAVEVHALVARWLEDERKRRARRQKPQVAVVHFTLDKFFRGLGFGQDEGNE